MTHWKSPPSEIQIKLKKDIISDHTLSMKVQKIRKNNGIIYWPMPCASMYVCICLYVPVYVWPESSLVIEFIGLTWKPRKH